MEPFRRKGRDGVYIRYRNVAGRWVTLRGGDTRKEAYGCLERLENEVRMIRDGYLDVRQVEVAKASHRPMAEVIADFGSYLRSKRDTAGHVADTLRWIEVVAEDTGAKCLADIDAGAVEVFLGGLIERGRSARTRNAYFVAVNALMRWAVRRRMLSDNPLAGIERLTEATDRREVSRALTLDEFRRLLDGTPCPRRRLCYLVAGRTGLRWGEIARLTWADLDLDGGWVNLRAEATKGGRSESLPLSAELVQAIRDHLRASGADSGDKPGGTGTRRGAEAFGRHESSQLGDASVPAESSGPGEVLRRRNPFDQAEPSRRSEPSGRLFRTVPTLRVFKLDVGRAGIVYETERGQVDRKSLRKTFCTHLALRGVDFRVAVRLMRHSDPKLTMKIYTDPMLLDMQAAVGKLSGDTLVTKNVLKPAVG